MSGWKKHIAQCILEINIARLQKAAPITSHRLSRCQVVLPKNFFELSQINFLSQFEFLSFVTISVESLISAQFEFCCETKWFCEKVCFWFFILFFFLFFFLLKKNSSLKVCFFILQLIFCEQIC